MTKMDYEQSFLEVKRLQAQIDVLVSTDSRRSELEGWRDGILQEIKEYEAKKKMKRKK